MLASEYSPIEGTEIRIVSLTGQVISVFRNTDESGRALTCKVKAVKNGGVKSFEFSVDRQTNLPVFQGMLVEVWKDMSLFSIGYSNTVPRPGSNSNLLVVSCLGYMHKLKSIIVNKDYLSSTLSNIIADNSTEMAEVDIIYDASKIDLPGAYTVDIEFTKKTLDNVIEKVLQIANQDFNNAEYRWFIDNERKLNIELISQTPERSLFEGYNYQFPEVETDDSHIINRVVSYKSSSVNENELDLVAIYEDTDSQGKYGVREEKYVFPDVTDNTTIGYMSNEILERFKDPETKISIENLVGVDFPFKFYKISNRLDNYWSVLSECDDFDGWDLTNASPTVVTLEDTIVLTGRQSIKCALETGSLDTYIRLDVEPTVFSPEIFRTYLFLEESCNLLYVLYAEDGTTFEFSLGTADIAMEVNTTSSITKNVEVNNGGVIKNIYVTIQISYTDQWLKIEVPLTLRSVNRVDIKFLTDAVTNCYIDRLEVLSNAYDTNKLTLENITYTLNRDYALSNAEFGREFETLADVVKNKVKDGDISLSLATRI